MDTSHPGASTWRNMQCYMWVDMWHCNATPNNMFWHNTLQYDKLWSELWYCRVQYDMIQHKIRHDKWHNMMWHDTTSHNTTRYNPIPNDTMEHDIIRRNTIQHMSLRYNTTWHVIVLWVTTIRIWTSAQMRVWSSCCCSHAWISCFLPIAPLFFSTASSLSPLHAISRWHHWPAR